MEEKIIWYLCDGEKEGCKKTHCYKKIKENPCRHTKDINHAVNFKKTIYGIREVYRESGCDENNTAGTDSKKCKNLLTLEMEDRNLYLEGMKLKGIKEFVVSKSSALPKGKAELKITLIVDFPDNKQAQNLLQAETGLE